MANKNLFNSIKLTKPRKNVFDLTHDVKLSCNMGELVPIMCLEAVPGDKFNISCESLLRFAPMVSPVMHRMDVTMHYYFVPNRILWPGWEKWIVNDPSAGAFPTFPVGMIADHYYTPLMNYLGIPEPLGTNTETISAMALAAYQCVYNEYYRDQNLIGEIGYQLSDGDNGPNAGHLAQLRRRAWEHDYFTSALPFAQKGAAVDLPLGEFQDVFVYRNGPNPPGGLTVLDGTPDDQTVFIEESTNPDIVGPALFAKTSEINPEATNVNDLRRAFRLQEWLEKNARAGTRYIENILAHFGVKSSDARLQRPEYITGTKSPVVISEILNTTGTTELPQGNMAGHGVSVTSGQYGNYYCEEHGYIIGIMSILPRTAYQQGIPKHFLKTTDPFQYYWPTFANIGEQEVLNKELYAFQGTTGNDTFGYVPRYAEYKYQPSRVAGDFQTTLDFWHLARKFATTPALNQDFVECTPDTRIFAVEDPDVQKLYCHVLNKVKAIRPMPKFGTPTI